MASQVEVITKKLSDGRAVEIQRHMAAGSCIGMEVWQRPGLLGEQLEQQLTSLVIALVSTADYHTALCLVPEPGHHYTTLHHTASCFMLRA